MKRIIYPGTFDPIHYGHIDIARRASRLFDEVYICVSDNQHKNPLFSHKERVEMIEECTSDLDNVSAYSNPNNLVVNFADSKYAVAIIRGLRHVSDFELEFQMANVNHGINPEISTILMVSNERFLHLNSSIIRELAEYKTDLSKFVPKSVEDRLIEKFKGK
jgi:pantetheine-phosphate adenylyltransferase